MCPSTLGHPVYRFVIVSKSMNLREGTKVTPGDAGLPWNPEKSAYELKRSKIDTHRVGASGISINMPALLKARKVTFFFMPRGDICLTSGTLEGTLTNFEIIIL